MEQTHVKPMKIKKGVGGWTFDIINHLFMAFLMVIFIYPFLNIIAISFSSPIAISAGRVTWLPIDFNEVSITRRAYRDGQNEYLLNGQRVRLKEIAELLGRSGLAERTYTIIGQGLVDAALSLKPEERRRFFEEAAGIGLYRGRREEALTRLDTTRRNLERVLDILSELEPRLASLEKQAKDHDITHPADLRLLLRDWYGYHWHPQQGEVVLAWRLPRPGSPPGARPRGHAEWTFTRPSARRCKNSEAT